MNQTHSNNLSDAELITHYKQSNNSTFVATLYQRYTHLIFGVCMKYLKNEQDAQDASIQIFEKMLKDLLKYQIQDFKPWLYTATKTFSLMQLRAGNSIQKKEKEMQNYFLQTVEINPELHLFNTNLKEAQLTYMEDCIKTLNNDQQLCIELFYLQEKSYQQVSDATNFTLNNVKSFIQNGKRNLKNCIEAKSK